MTEFFRGHGSDSEEYAYGRATLMQGSKKTHGGAQKDKSTFYHKPNVSYSTLIAQAILESSEQKLTLKEIYEWIMAKYPFYQSQKGNWQNSIRHNLSLNKAFYKVPRSANNPGKGSFWCLDQEVFDVSSKLKCSRPRKSPKSAAQNLDLETHRGMGSVREILTQKEEPHLFDFSNIKVSPTVFNGDLQDPELYFDITGEQPTQYYSDDSFNGNSMFKFL